MASTKKIMLGLDPYCYNLKIKPQSKELSSRVPGMQEAGGTAGTSDMRSFRATVTCHWRNHNGLNKTPPHCFCVIEKKSNHKTKKKKNSRKEKNSQ